MSPHEVRISLELCDRQALEAAAKREKTSMAHIARIGIRAYLKRLSDLYLYEDTGRDPEPRRFDD